MTERVTVTCNACRKMVDVRDGYLVRHRDQSKRICNGSGRSTKFLTADLFQPPSDKDELE